MSSATPKSAKAKAHDKAMSLIVTPGDGAKPLLDGIASAKSSVDILIFRFDRKEIEDALLDAVHRGVVVRALIAWTNRGGERHLRELEARLLAAGALVARTASDLVRYHGKMMIIDRKVLYVLGFNFTKLDIDRSRSFGIVTTKPSFVKEALRLFEFDSTRKPYTPECRGFLVSPLNSREELGRFIEGAKKSLSIYDPGLRDREMVRLLEERAAAGVEIRILGKFRRGSVAIPSHPLVQPRLHARVILRDGAQVFIGSQSLRAIELDGRRELGLIIPDRDICAKVGHVFDEDWEAMAKLPDATMDEMTGEKFARKVAKAMTRELPSVADVVESVSAEMTGGKVDLGTDSEALEQSIREAVKSAVQDVIQEATLSSQ
ncbi:MAG TPA: phospholipase D-like domain-containing protein [Bryobacteraceae bacterium]|nr:phospholipase D-like domain-containing protein [Bryobacteraceae bacterium]